MARDLTYRRCHAFDVFFRQFNLEAAIKKFAWQAVRNRDVKEWKTSENGHRSNTHHKNHDYKAFQDEFLANAFFVWHDNKEESDEVIKAKILASLKYWRDESLLQQKHPSFRAKTSNRQWMKDTDPHIPLEDLDESDEYHVIAPNSTEEIIDRLHRHELIYRNTPKRQWPVFMAVLEFNLSYTEAATVCCVPERTFRDWRQKLTDIFSVHDERKRPLSDEELGELNKIRKELEAKIDAIR